MQETIKIQHGMVWIEYLKKFLRTIEILRNFNVFDLKKRGVTISLSPCKWV